MADRSTEKSIFVLKVFQKRHYIEVSAFEKKGPVRDFVEHRFSEEEINKHCQEIVQLFNKSNRSGKVSAQGLKRLKALCQLLYDELLPVEAKQKLKATQAEHLILDVDDKLNHLPWELLFDGDQFFCLKFSMGRIVRTKNVSPIVAPPRRNFNLPLKMLVLFDPQGNLQESYAVDELNEGELLLDCLGQQAALAIDFKSSPIDSAYVKMNLRDYDIVHYAGHAEYDSNEPAKSGWLLADRKLLATDIIKMAGNEKPLPGLIFSNACQSGITAKWKAANIHDLAKAFLLTGVQHYIGTLWDILNKPSSHFALAFYKELAKEDSLGTALKKARLNLIQKYGEQTILWGSYILYGDPTVSYLSIARDTKGVKKPLTVAPGNEGVKDDVRRGPAQTIETPYSISSKWPKDSKKTLIITSGIILFALISWIVTNTRRFNEDTLLRQKYKLALKYLDEGNYEAARNISQEIKLHNPQAAYNHIILGDVLFNQGEIARAMLEYTQAAEAAETPSRQKALAYNRLGRGYTNQEKYAQALDNYNKAINHDRQSPDLHTDRGVILKKMGNYKEAQQQFDQALKLNPQDKLAALFKQETQQRISNLENSERQQRLDKLITELVETYHRQETVPPVVEEGLDKPLITITFLCFKSQGSITSREGEGEYILLKIMDYLNDTGKVKVVERQLIERLLEELKLGSSELANPQVSAKLGRILAAKLIVTGNIISYSGSIQAGMRLIETETTAIVGAIAKNLDKKLPLDKIAENLATELMNKIEKQYLPQKVNDVS